MFGFETMDGNISRFAKTNPQDYDPEWSDTEASDSLQTEPHDSGVPGPSLATAINAGVTQDAVPVDNNQVDDAMRQQIAAVLEESLRRSQAASAGAAPAAPLGAYAGGFRLQHPNGAPAPIIQSSCVQHLSRTVWRQGAYVSQCTVTMPGEASCPAVRPSAAGATDQSCDFGIGPVSAPVHPFGQQAADAMPLNACAPGVPIAAGRLARPRGQLVLPPPRGSAAQSQMDATQVASQVPDEQGLTALPPRPPRRLPQPRATRSAPYDLPGPESTREERAAAAMALGMSRRQYERAVLGMER